MHFIPDYPRLAQPQLILFLDFHYDGLVPNLPHLQVCEHFHQDNYLNFASNLMIILILGQNLSN